MSGFWRFLALFINNGIKAAVNSFISNNISIIFIEIIRPQKFMIKILVIALIIILSFFIHSNLIIIRFDKVGTI